MLMCSCVRLLVVVNNMWVIIEFRLGSIFVLLFSEILRELRIHHHDTLILIITLDLSTIWLKKLLDFNKKQKWKINLNYKTSKNTNPLYLDS